MHLKSWAALPTWPPQQISTDKRLYCFSISPISVSNSQRKEVKDVLLGSSPVTQMSDDICRTTVVLLWAFRTRLLIIDSRLTLTRVVCVSRVPSAMPTALRFCELEESMKHQRVTGVFQLVQKQEDKPYHVPLTQGVFFYLLYLRLLRIPIPLMRSEPTTWGVSGGKGGGRGVGRLEWNLIHF